MVEFSRSREFSPSRLTALFEIEFPKLTASFVLDGKARVVERVVDFSLMKVIKFLYYMFSLGGVLCKSDAADYYLGAFQKRNTVYTNMKWMLSLFSTAGPMVIPFSSRGLVFFL